jgi:hypothetical protein
MADAWYFGWGNRRFGPFSEAQLMDLAERGRVQPSDIIWKEGIEKGLLAGNVKNLFRPPPVDTVAPAAIETVALQPTPMTASIGSSRSLPSTPAKFNDWLASAHHQKAEIPPEIPDGLSIKPIQGLDDSPSPIAPATDRSPDLDATEDRAGAAIPSGGNAGNSKPKGAGNHQPSGQTQAPKRTMRAVALKGAVIMNQNGEIVQYRKKCIRCAYEDQSRTSRPIRVGIHRDRFFCPKCRKMGEVEIQCLI